jgi:hypothetical protein
MRLRRIFGSPCNIPDRMVRRPKRNVAVVELPQVRNIVIWSRNVPRGMYNYARARDKHGGKNICCMALYQGTKTLNAMLWPCDSDDAS